VIQALIGVVLVGFLATLVVGLATGRIAWRQQGCCPADPAHDLRMRTNDTTDPSTSTTRRQEP
jgi:hypothetical protein